MGLLSGGIARARTRQKESLVGEAQKAGSQVVDVIEIGDDAQASRAALGATLKVFVGGSLRNDGAQIVLMNAAGWPHVYVQPYAGMNALPGEHHAVLSGSLPSPALLRASQGMFSGRPQWESPADPRLAAAMNVDAAIGGLVKRMVWDWKVGLGAFELDYTLQLRSVGDGATHLMMRAGRYGGFTTYEVGIAVFLAACRTLHGWLQPIAAPPQTFLGASAFEAVLPLLYGRSL